MKADLDHPVARDFATDRVSDWGDRDHQHVLPILLAHVVAQPLGPYPLIRAIAKLCGGGGGGKPNLAQAGGRDASKLDEAIAAAKTQLQGAIG